MKAYEVIRDATSSDSGMIAEIYNDYILNTAITFEEKRVSPAEINNRLGRVQGSGLPWIVATENSAVLGYAYAVKWKDRSAYRFAAEMTVYLAADALGKGIGTSLYKELLTRLRDKDIQTAIGGVTLPNTASIALHEKLGMKKVAHFEKVGFKFNRWHDVGYWQLNFI
ncbi:GNAT family N-acetyltransferase [Microbulbifer sp. 2201CG32-9]|uniref:GNAT family N-acetyltransferase n=1 Tax=Microbulbifer sp. 2201CG32-9 TaxID=3232309 RepID=UPI00345C0AEB